MTEIYVDLFKEHIMHNTLGNTTKTLAEIAEALTVQYQNHSEEIARAYQFVSRELAGNFL